MDNVGDDFWNFAITYFAIGQSRSNRELALSSKSFVPCRSHLVRLTGSLDSDSLLMEQERNATRKLGQKRNAWVFQLRPAASVCHPAPPEYGRRDKFVTLLEPLRARLNGLPGPPRQATWWQPAKCHGHRVVNYFTNAAHSFWCSGREPNRRGRPSPLAFLARQDQ